MASKIDNLPNIVREEIERRIIVQRFKQYDQIETWLHEEGFTDINESNLRSYGNRIRKNPPEAIKLYERLTNLGIKPICSKRELAPLLSELGMLRMKEHLLIAKITGSKDRLMADLLDGRS